MSGVGINHVRRHVIRHVTCLGANEDYTSRCNLESSKIQHVILKTFRDERRIVTRSTIAKRFFQGGSHMCSRRYNSLYCTNRTSLRTCSMLRGTAYIHGTAEATRR